MSADTIHHTKPVSGPDHHRGPGIMAPILAGVGALLIVMAGMIHFYAVPKLAVAPVDVNTVTQLEAKGATLFDTGTLKPITTDLAITNRTVGDGTATSKAPADTVVWASMTTIRSADGVIRSQSTSSSAMNDKSAMSVNCCGNFIESAAGERTPVTLSGLVYKYPFFTEKHNYQVWDSTLKTAVTAKYTGTTAIQGMKVYTFVSDVPASVVGHESLPASVFGLPGKGNVNADSYYQNHQTQYVEPETGAIINSVSDMKQWYSAQGSDLMTMDGHLNYTDAQVAKYVHDYKGKAAQLGLLSGPAPWVVMVIGLALVAGGFVRGRRTRA